MRIMCATVALLRDYSSPRNRRFNVTAVSRHWQEAAHENHCPGANLAINLSVIAAITVSEVRGLRGAFSWSLKPTMIKNLC